MSSILLLTRLQIAQTIGGLRAKVEKHAGTNGAMAGTALIALAALGAVGWLGFAAYGLLGSLGIDKAVFDMLFLICGLLTFAFSLPTVLTSFFGASDIDDLLPLPVSPFAIVLSKALGSLASAYLWTLLLVGAPLAGWGIAAGAGAHFWVSWLLAVLLTPLMPVAYAGILSILVASAFRGLRRKDTITTLTTVISIAVSVGVFFVSNGLKKVDGIGQVLGQAADAMGGVVMAFPAYGFCVHALQQSDALGLALFALISLAAFVAFVVVARFLYLSIVTSISSGGAKAKDYDATSQAESSPLASLFRCELRRLTRNSSVLLYYVLYPMVVTPALLVFSISSGSLPDLNKLLASFGDVTTATAGFLLAVVVLLATICCLSNKTAATCVSREGSNWSTMKVIPVPYTTQILAKTLVGFALSSAITLIIAGGGAVVLVVFLGIDPLVSACGVVHSLAAAWLMSCVGAWADARDPSVAWGDDGDVNPKTLKGSAGTLRAMLVGLVYAALPVLATPLVGLEPRTFIPLIALVGVVAAVAGGRVLIAAAARSLASFE